MKPAVAVFVHCPAQLMCFRINVRRDLFPDSPSCEIIDQLIVNKIEDSMITVINDPTDKEAEYYDIIMDIMEIVNRYVDIFKIQQIKIYADNSVLFIC